MDICLVTNKGKVRKSNEDTAVVLGNEFPVAVIVADGMGGHRSGKYASTMAVNLISEEILRTNIYRINESDIHRMIEKTNQKIYQESLSDAELFQMGTTLTMAIIRQNEFVCGHIGDSRLYLNRNNRVQRITTDHTFVQNLVDRGIISMEEARNNPYRNIITRAVGTENIQADVFQHDFREGDALLFCSDGLTEHISDLEIQSCLSTGYSARKISGMLLESALDRGGSDNITVVVVCYYGGLDRD